MNESCQIKSCMVGTVCFYGDYASERKEVVGNGKIKSRCDSRIAGGLGIQ